VLSQKEVTAFPNAIIPKPQRQINYVTFVIKVMAKSIIRPIKSIIRLIYYEIKIVLAGGKGTTYKINKFVYV
jgi:hypothetical protein